MMRARVLSRGWIAVLLFPILLGGCRSAPIVDPQPQKIHPIEVPASGYLTRTRWEIGQGDNVIWLNETTDRRLWVEIQGPLEGSLEDYDAADAFAESEGRAHTREGVPPGDGVCLRFPRPGVFRFTITGLDTPVEGEIVVEGRI